nr:ATP-dependent RNA helicase [Andalucia godoyi]|eukprot:ANDGO_06412.mRNA.1 Putative DEAD-box ATP-dependent RNA helicase 29
MTEHGEATKKAGSFQGMALHQPILKGVLHKGYKVPTPIQRKTIPIALSGRDLVAMARTGSGKTAAFLIPVLNKLEKHSDIVGVRAVILSPTRELAVQTLVFAKAIAKHTDLRFSCIVGGDSMEEQYLALASNPDVLIATPGRLMHHLDETDMSLKLVQMVVFDEADRLFEMGFAAQISSIMSRIPAEQRQTLLFSATMPSMLMDFTKAGLKRPAIVRLDTETKISDDLALEFFVVNSESKLGALIFLLRNVIPENDMTIVFVATRHHVEFVSETLKHFGLAVSMVYGTMEQTSRVYHVNRFRSGEAKVLVVTDVAARGIDIPLLNNVINFDFPSRPKLFIHRAGRAARAGRSGTAYSLFSADEMPYVLDLHMFLHRSLSCRLEDVARPRKENSVYGRIPQYIVDDLDDSVRTLCTRSDGWAVLKRSMDNAYKMYFKTRSAPSKKGVFVSKSMKTDAIHPNIVSKLSADSGKIVLDSLDMMQKIKTFRPKTTTFEQDPLSKEAAMMQAKRKSDQSKVTDTVQIKVEFYDPSADEHGAEMLEDHDADDDGDAEDDEFENEEQEEEEERGGADKNDAALPRKRPAAASDDLRPAKKTKKASESWRDEKFFIPYTQQHVADEQALAIKDRTTNYRLEDMVMDMEGEDQDSLVKKKATFVWDAKKKNYVKVFGSAESVVDPLGKRRKEHDKKPKNTYNDWREKHHMRIPQVGEKEGQDVDNARQMIKRMGPRRKGIWHPSPSDAAAASSSKSKGFKSELKSADQIRKQRKEEKKQADVEKKRKQANDVRREKGRKIQKRYSKK